MALSNDLVLEPTYVTIKTQQGDFFVGVKVIPFYIDSNVDLVNLLITY
jgi:hypothetical protein